jgi:cyanophycin synthetase
MTRPPREPDVTSGFPSETIVDSRRLMGPNLFNAHVGAVLDVSLSVDDSARNAARFTAWRRRVLQSAAVLDWPETQTRERVYNGGASLFLSAPVDQLMTATEVAERAWVYAESVVAAEAPPPDDDTFATLRAMATAERKPNFRAIWDEAQRRGLNVTFDDTSVAVGSGCGAQQWPIDALPNVHDIPWDIVLDVPIVLVTGSNGKTTVVRMVAAMARAAGHTVGYTCTDGVWINGLQIESGDYSGPAGARTVLRDATVTLAVLETARGGILRRGLAVQHADVAAVVTLSADHFGDYGIMDLQSLAQVKLVTKRAVESRGAMIINGDAPLLVEALQSYRGAMVAVHSGRPPERSANALVGSPTGTLSESELNQIPATLGGTAQHNVLNAQIAIEIATALHLGPAAKDALLSFGSHPADNVGRLMRRDLADVSIVVDYAHNPQSIRALIDGTRSITATRRAIILGTGGDRDDTALQDIASAAFDSGVIDFYIAKEMPRFLRGRPPGTLSTVFLDTLRARGVHEAAVTSATDDIAAVRTALAWARPGDLLLLGVHDQRDRILQLLDQLKRDSWRAGQPIR